MLVLKDLISKSAKKGLPSILILKTLHVKSEKKGLQSMLILKVLKVLITSQIGRNQDCRTCWF